MLFKELYAALFNGIFCALCVLTKLQFCGSENDNIYGHKYTQVVRKKSKFNMQNTLNKPS